MFVEKLTKEEVLGFYRDCLIRNGEEYVLEFLDNLEDAKDYKNMGDKITYILKGIKFTITDFEYSSEKTFRLYAGLHNRDWLKFMYKRFGEPYRQAFIESRKQERKRVLTFFAKRFDNDTAKYLSELKAEQTHNM